MKSQPMEESTRLQQLRDNPASRRAFLKTMGAAGLGMAAISLLDGCGGGNNGGGVITPTATPTPTPTGMPVSFPSNLQGFPGAGDIKILNYALTLELLEADLYRQALNLATGRALSADLESSPSAYSLTVGGGGLDSFNTAAAFAYLRDFAFVENAHALFLQTAIPDNVQIGRARAYKFATPVAPNLKAIMTAILPLEETGVRAYLGAVKSFQSNANLQVAASIYSTEARHSSAISYILGLDPGPRPMAGDKVVAPRSGAVSSNTFEFFLEPETVISRVKPLIIL